METISGFTTATLADALRRIARRMETSADDLNALDGKLGDGDLGITMSRGGAHVLEALPAFSEDMGQAFLTCAQAFTKESGSSFGTLLAFGLMSAAKATKGRSTVPWSEVSSLLRGAFNTMAARGKASLGDKTVLDVLDAAARATEGLNDPVAILQAALIATQETMDQLRDKPAQIGRARIFGDRSIGLDDPGMVVFHSMLKALEDSP
jgi:phosphoenolpyruvate---glycerone phosphotransferase subunit DhaL